MHEMPTCEGSQSRSPVRQCLVATDSPAGHEAAGHAGDLQARLADIEKQLQDKDTQLSRVRAQLCNSELALALVTAELNSERNKSSVLAASSFEEQRRLRSLLEGKHSELKSVLRALKGSQDRKEESRRRRSECDSFLKKLHGMQHLGDRLLDCMHRHAADAQVQLVCCMCLLVVTDSHDVNSNAVCAASGIECILAAVRTHRDESDLVVAGFGVLGMLSAKNAENQMKIAQQGAIDIALEAMTAHKECTDVLVQACVLLRNLAGRSDNQDAIAAAGGIESILDAMRTQNSDSELIIQACRALANLAVHNAGNQIKIATVGGIECIIAAMSAFPKLGKPRPLCSTLLFQRGPRFVGSHRPKATLVGRVSWVSFPSAPSLLGQPGFCSQVLCFVSDPQALYPKLKISTPSPGPEAQNRSPQP